MGERDVELAADFERRLEQEKLAALKEFAYGAGHEINNPLANIAARAQTLLRDEPDPERQRALVAIHRQAMRAHEMIADLMLFAQPPALDVAAFDLGGLVDEVVDQHRSLADERSIAIVYESVDEPLEMHGDRTQLAVAIAAVVSNAIEAIGANGKIAVTLRWTTRDDERWAEIVVRDDGPGISDEVRRHLFDPFFSGREAGRGLGFGLSKCWRIVNSHDGHVAASNVPVGAELVIALRPLTAE